MAIARWASRMWKALGFFLSSPTRFTRWLVSSIMSEVIGGIERQQQKAGVDHVAQIPRGGLDHRHVRDVAADARQRARSRLASHDPGTTRHQPARDDKARYLEP